MYLVIKKLLPRKKTKNCSDYSRHIIKSNFKVVNGTVCPSLISTKARTIKKI